MASPPLPEKRVDPVRLIHVITGLETGGAEMMLQKVISRTGDSFDHQVISLRTEGSVAKLLRAQGIAVSALGDMSGRPNPALLGRLVTALREAKPDLVQGWMYHGNFASRVARSLMGGRWPLHWSIRCSIGEAGTEKPMTRLVRRLGVSLSGPISSIIYNSDRARRQHEAIGYPSSRSLVIPNGFDTDRFRPSAPARAAFRRLHGIEDDTFVIGHVARVDPMKDQQCLLAAAKKVVEASTKCVFVLAGRGVPELAHPSAPTAGLVKSLEGKILLLPEQTDVSALMPAFDLFVLSSAFGEGFPNVLGEALCCGIPCLATDVGDCAAIIGNVGRIVPPRNPDMLAAATLEFLADADLGRRVGPQLARDRAKKNFSLATVADRYRDQWLRGSDATRPGGARCAA